VGHHATCVCYGAGANQMLFSRKKKRKRKKNDEWLTMVAMCAKIGEQVPLVKVRHPKPCRLPPRVDSGTCMDTRTR
jgi:hypothetical protein